MFNFEARVTEELCLYSSQKVWNSLKPIYLKIYIYTDEFWLPRTPSLPLQQPLLCMQSVFFFLHFGQGPFFSSLGKGRHWVVEKELSGTSVCIQSAAGIPKDLKKKKSSI